MIAVDPYEVTLAVLGAVGLLAAAIPGLVRGRPVSLPMILVAVGVILFAAVPQFSPPDPRSELELTERLTEMGVIVSLLAAGLAINQPIGWRSWGPTWRLLAVTMPLSIALTAVLGVAALGLPVASAVLLGASLAPTDPVIADELTAGDPDDSPSGEDDVRATLTSEAGLNDALAFPFVYLALTLNGVTAPGELLVWFTLDVVVRIGVGVVVGVACGWIVQWLAFRSPHRASRLSTIGDGFAALAFLFLSYGLAELAHGYGFVAVFVAALTFRRAERSHEYHRTLHEFSRQLEAIAMIVLLVLFGGAIVAGILDEVTWAVLGVAVLLVLVVRPVASTVGLLGSRVSRRNRAIIAVFGIRGVGSFYYLAYGLRSESFPEAPTLWAAVSVTVLLSIVIHGTTAVAALRRIDRRRTA
jgi:NhaP-type Na+/H+ or K+/H+ antiporter